MKSIVAGLVLMVVLAAGGHLPGHAGRPGRERPSRERPGERAAGGNGETSATGQMPPPMTLTENWQLQDTAKVAEPGATVSQPSYHPAAWYAAVVPGTVLTSLVKDGVYPEPLYGENNRPDKIPESLCRTSYWYRKTFATPAAFAGRRVWLNFAGINYIAEVWLNGRDLGRIEGAFARGLFDVTDFVSAKGPNALAVQILPPPHPGNPKEQTLGNGYGPNGGDLEHDTPTFVDAVGWDWMPAIRDRDMGIWQDVTLSATGAVMIRDPYVTSTLPLPRTDSAELGLDVSLRNATSNPVTGTLIGSVDGHEFRHPVTLAPSETQTVKLTPADAAALHLDHPKLWWPNGYGEAHLYTMPLRFVTSGGAISDSQDVRFGVRSISYYGAINPGKFTLTVNGRPILARGGNWGMDEAMKRTPLARLRSQILLHKEVGYSMIRNWVGMTTQEDFYRLCDENGIMVWDEYWLDDTTRKFIPAQMFLDNAREKLLRFRNHPCIAVYCERNEFPVDPKFAPQLRALTHELDPYRFYQPISSDGGGVGGHGSYGVEPVEYYFKPYTDAFHTEIGAPSVPTLEALHAMMPQKDWATYNDDWAEHDMCQSNYFPVLTQRYGPIADTNDFVRKAQLSGYEGYRAMYEGRNAKMFNPASGVLIWMSNPAQPSMVWQIYSYDLEPNSTYFGVKKACERVHVQMTPTGHIQIINNTEHERKALTMTATVYNLDGTHAFDQTFTGSAAPDSASDMGDINWPATLSPVHFVRLKVVDDHAYSDSDNFYWHTTAAAGQDCSALQTLPKVALDVTATRQQRNYSNGICLLEVKLHNPSKSVALMTHLQLRRETTGERVLPVFYSDNYVSLFPGETRGITVLASQIDMHGDSPALTVDGWNVTAIGARADGLGSVTVTTNAAVGVAKVAQIRNIRCGVGWVEGYAADCLYSGGGGAVMTDDVIDTKSDPLAGPAVLYRSERYGDVTYTIPVPKNHSYTVRLHFAETKYDQTGKRIFNVDINGARALSDFDIFAAAGGKDKAVVKTVSDIAPDANGNLVIHLAEGTADSPKICGIQVVEGSAVAQNALTPRLPRPADTPQPLRPALTPRPPLSQAKEGESGDARAVLVQASAGGGENMRNKTPPLSLAREGAGG